MGVDQDRADRFIKQLGKIPSLEEENSWHHQRKLGRERREMLMNLEDYHQRGRMGSGGRPSERDLILRNRIQAEGQKIPDKLRTIWERMGVE